jgi:hypothetical protein
LPSISAIGRRDRRQGKALGQGDHRADQPAWGYLPVSTSAFSIIGCALHVPHSGALFWPDIEKSRAEARRLLKEAGAEGLSFELVNRDVDQPYKYLGIWLIDQWSKIGLHVTQNVVPTGPWFAALRSGDFSVSTGGSCHGIVNPVLDVQPVDIEFFRILVVAVI